MCVCVCVWERERDGKILWQMVLYQQFLFLLLFSVIWHVMGLSRWMFSAIIALHPQTIIIAWSRGITSADDKWNLAYMMGFACDRNKINESFLWKWACICHSYRTKVWLRSQHSLLLSLNFPCQNECCRSIFIGWLA